MSHIFMELLNKVLTTFYAKSIDWLLLPFFNLSILLLIA